MRWTGRKKIGIGRKCFSNKFFLSISFIVFCVIHLANHCIWIFWNWNLNFFETGTWTKFEGLNLHMIWTVFNQFSCKIRNKFIWHGERWMETSNFSSLVFVSKFVSFYRLILKCKQFVVVMMVLCLRSGKQRGNDSGKHRTIINYPHHLGPLIVMFPIQAKPWTRLHRSSAKCKMRVSVSVHRQFSYFIALHLHHISFLRKIISTLVPILHP